MTPDELFEQVIAILKPYTKAPVALAVAKMETSILADLKVNSARLVDVVLEIEDRFDIAIKDEEADRVRTIGDAVSLILAHVPA